MPRFSLRRRKPTIIMHADRAREAGQWQVAAGLYRIALDRTPDNPTIWIQYGHALKESGNRSEAETAYRTAIAFAPDDADAHLQLGHVLKLDGRAAEAQASYMRALALDHSLADAVLELRDLGRAEEPSPKPNGSRAPTALAATAAANGHAIAHPLRRGKDSIITRADRARDAGQWPLAARLYRNALDRNPNRPPIWVQYGHALKESGHLAEAESAYRAAIAGDPDVADSHLQLGHALKLQGKTEEAKAAYLRTVAIEPSHTEPLRELKHLGWAETAFVAVQEIAGTDISIFPSGLDSPPDQMLSQVERSAELEISIDGVRLSENRLVLDQRNLHLAGWIVSTEKIESVTIELGDGTTRVVHYGLPRLDVLAIRPHNPNGAFVGFSVFVELLPQSCSAITFNVTMKSGITLTQSYGVVLESTSTLPTNFRTVVYAEKRHLLRESAPPARLCGHCYVIANCNTASEAQSAERLLERTLNSIAETRTGSFKPVVLMAHNHDKVAAFSEQLTLQIADDDSDLWSKLRAHSGAWLTFLQPGDVVAPFIDLFLDRAAHADDEFVYWDEFAVEAEHETRLFKIPGGPFVTLLHHSFIGRGWAVHITDDFFRDCAADDLDRLAISIPLRAFMGHKRCAHIPEFLSRHRYAQTPFTLSRDDAHVRNNVLQACRSLYGPLHLVVSEDGNRSSELHLDIADQFWPKVSVIIPTRGAEQRVLQCLQSLHALTDYPKMEIIILDHIPLEQEALPLKEQIKSLADTVIPITGTFNWSEFNNIGARAATGEVLLFLNDDVEIIEPAWLRRLVPYLSLEEVGAVGPRLLYSYTSVQSCGVSLLPEGGYARNDFAFTEPEAELCHGVNRIPRNCTSLSGAAILTRRETFVAVGGFDEALPLTFNDLDYHMRLRQHGLQVVVDPKASLIHYEKTSRALIPEQEMDDRYWNRWRREHLLGDRYIHPAYETRSGMYKIEAEPLQVVWNESVADVRSNIKRIIILRLDHIGDFTVSIPAFMHLRGAFPDAMIDVVVGRWNYNLAKSLGIFENVLVYDFYKERSGDGVEADLGDCRREFDRLVGDQTYDLAVDFRCDSGTRSLLTGINSRFRAGFSYGLNHPWLDISLEWEGNLKRWRKRSSASEMVSRLVSILAESFPAQGNANIDYWDRTNLPALDRVARVPRRFMTASRRVAMHPFAGNSIKMWPSRRWTELVNLLTADGVAVLVIGSATDSNDERDCLSGLNAAGAIDTVGLFSLEELLQVLRLCDCFVGCDSGPKHLAASVGVPVVCVQSGFVDPITWGPMNLSGVSLVRQVTCAPCYLDNRSACPRNLDCMEGIAVRDVYSLIRRNLSISDSARSSTISEPPLAGGRGEPPSRQCGLVRANPASAQQ